MSENKPGTAQINRRAEEIIAEVYRQILEIRGSGKQPKRIVIDRKSWNLVDDYRTKLGILDGPLPDYLAENSLFGVEIWYGINPEIRVE